MKKVLAVVGAAVVGFAAGILTAPKSGKETRADIKKKAEDFKDEAARRAEQAKKAAKDGAASIKAGSRKVGDAVSETAQDVKEKVEKRFK